jgi:type I restriction enzyme S subunit
VTNSGITRANHWKLRKLSSVADVLSGSTPSTKDSTNFDGDIPWITPKDLATLKIHYIGRGERNVSSKGKKSSSLKDVPIGSVVLSTRAPVGLIAIAKAKLTTNQGCKSLVPKKGEVESSFLYHLLKHNESYLQQFASGTTFEELSLSVLGDMEFNFPPLKIQERIGIVLSAFDNSIANAYSQIDLIDGLLSNKFRYWFEQYKYLESDTNDEELIFNTCRSVFLKTGKLVKCRK